MGMERGQATKRGGGECHAKPHNNGHRITTERKDFVRDPPGALGSGSCRTCICAKMCCRGPARKKRNEAAGEGVVYVV